jgi:two-component system sensor histidine kinase SenX3
MSVTPRRVYDLVVTALGCFLLSVGAALVGLIAGVAVGRLKLLAGRDSVDDQESRRGPTVADLAQRVVGASHNGIAVLNRYGDVVLHNRRAAELGVVRNLRPDERARKAAEQAVQLGEPVEVDISPLEHRGRQPEAVHAEVRPLGDGFTVVDAADESDAVRLEATRRDFVANVSHELKTPVGAIGLLAEAVLGAADDPHEVDRFASTILSEANRLGALVTELIALSRLQGAERLPELATVDVDGVVLEALNRGRAGAKPTDIEITVDEPSGLLVSGDRTLLITALSNLVENAIAYSPPGSPVSISRRLAGGMVEIAVTDRGIGIAPEHQQRVFERFFRVDPARSRATGGTGLGLAIVKHVAANHGGGVRLWSRPGIGSTFTMRIPAHPRREPADLDHASTSGVNREGVP